MTKKSELPKHLRRKYVTRASFAKMQGEKQRLERDIRTIIEGTKEQAVPVIEKYKRQYDQNKMLVDALRELLGKQPDLTKPKIDSNSKAFK